MLVECMYVDRLKILFRNTAFSCSFPVVLLVHVLLHLVLLSIFLKVILFLGLVYYPTPLSSIFKLVFPVVQFQRSHVFEYLVFPSIFWSPLNSFFYWSAVEDTALTIPSNHLLWIWPKHCSVCASMNLLCLPLHYIS